MAFDSNGSRLAEIMQGRNVGWLQYPEPYWRIAPFSWFGWLTGRGWSVKPYDERFIELVAEVLRSYPGSCLTYDAEPNGLKGDWQPLELNGAWKDSESGAYFRDLEADDRRAWLVPADVDAIELVRFLHRGAWSLWKPSEDKKLAAVLPRFLAQGALTTAIESKFHYLMTSSWENQFTELAINPELATRS